MDADNDTGPWKLKRTAQCAKCPWIKGVDPRLIPDGYTEEKHRNLRSTIADPNDPVRSITEPTRAMACHEMHDAHCIGWLYNQVGDGNNVGLRIRVATCENYRNIRLRGEQHRSFDDTLPAPEHEER